METLQAGRTDPWYMLDNAQTCLQALTQMPKRVVPTVPPLGPEAYAATVLLADAGATARAHALAGGRAAHASRARAHAAPVRPAAHRRQAHQHRSRAAHSIYRGSPRRGRPHRQAVPGLGAEPAGNRRACRRAPRVPHAQGLRPHGRRHGHQRIRVVHRKPAQQDHREHAAAFAGHPRHHPRRECHRGRTGERARSRARRAARRCRTSSIARMRWPPTGPARARRPRPWKFSSARSTRAATTSSPPPAACRRCSRLPPPAASRPSVPRARCRKLDGSRRRLVATATEVGGEEIVLSAPEEESSADLQLRDIYSRETQVNIAAVLRFIDAERSRNAPHVISEEAYRACHTLVGQLAHGRGAPRHSPHGAARTLGAQVVRQRRRPRSRGSRICSPIA